MPDMNEEQRQEAAYQEELDKEVGKVMTATEEVALGRAQSIDADGLQDTLRRMARAAGVMPSSEQDLLDDWFTYHAPKGDQADRYGEVRETGKYLAMTLMQLCPPCQERTVAIQKVREAVMWANAAIACNE